MNILSRNAITRSGNSHSPAKLSLVLGEAGGARTAGRHRAVARAPEVTDTGLGQAAAGGAASGSGARESERRRPARSMLVRRLPPPPPPPALRSSLPPFPLSPPSLAPSLSRARALSCPRLVYTYSPYAHSLSLSTDSTLSLIRRSKCWCACTRATAGALLSSLTNIKCRDALGRRRFDFAPVGGRVSLFCSSSPAQFVFVEGNFASLETRRECREREPRSQAYLLLPARWYFYCLHMCARGLCNFLLELFGKLDKS